MLRLEQILRLGIAVSNGASNSLGGYLYSLNNNLLGNNVGGVQTSDLGGLNNYQSYKQCRYRIMAEVDASLYGNYKTPNPLEMVSNLANLQNTQNQNKLFQQEYNSKLGLSQIYKEAH